MNISISRSGIAKSSGILIACLLMVAPAFAQDPSVAFPAKLQKELAARASNYTEVTLDKNMLNFGSKFMNNKDKDEAQAGQLIKKLDGIYVREYDFDKPGQYTDVDLAAIRKQFSAPLWTPMVRERSKNGESDDIYVKLVNGEVQGMFVLDAEPKELDLVYISGPIRPEDLNKLGGNFGIPKVNGGKNAGEPAK